MVDKIKPVVELYSGQVAQTEEADEVKVELQPELENC